MNTPEFSEDRFEKNKISKDPLWPAKDEIHGSYGFGGSKFEDTLYSSPVKIVNKSDNPLPAYATPGASGMDLRANLPGIDQIMIPSGGTAIIPTGIYVQVIPYFEIQIRSRSGMAANQHVFVLNSPGTIDSDYRGEIKIILHNACLWNDGDHEHVFLNSNLGKPVYIKHGERIAQMVLCPVNRMNLVEVESLEDTSRGQKGFGSTGND